MGQCKTEGCKNKGHKYYPYCQSCLEKRTPKLSVEHTIVAPEQKIEATVPKPIETTDDLRKKWPANVRTEDGHYVRSKAEQAVDNWLYNHGIPHAYEKRVPVPEIMYCDFFIPIGKKVYIEYWGLEGSPDYDERRNEKIRLYAENKKNLVELREKDIENLDDTLPVLLRPFLPETFSFD